MTRCASSSPPVHRPATRRPPLRRDSPSPSATCTPSPSPSTAPVRFVPAPTPNEPNGRGSTMSEYVGVASSGTSAAFFDLDRTLDLRIVGVHARPPGAQGGADPERRVRPRRLRRGDVQTPRRQRQHHRRGARAGAQGRHRDAPERPPGAQHRGAPPAARPAAARGPPLARPPPPGRTRHLHRVGRAAGDRRTAGPFARHDVGHRDPQPGRRRDVHRRARRSVLLRRRQGRGDA